MTKILIVDDHHVIIEGIITILKRENSELIYFQANNRKDALKIISQTEINILLLDIAIPKDYNSKPFEFEGLEFISEVKSLFIPTKIIVITQNSRAGLMKKLKSTGVSAIILKNRIAEEISIALKLTIAGKKYFSPAIKTENSQTAIQPEQNLSFLQEHILRLLAEGKTNFEIAELINRSERTVERNLSDLRYIFDSKTNPELIAKAFRLGLID